MAASAPAPSSSSSPAAAPASSKPNATPADTAAPAAASPPLLSPPPAAAPLPTPPPPLLAASPPPTSPPTSAPPKPSLPSTPPPTSAPPKPSLPSTPPPTSTPLPKPPTHSPAPPTPQPPTSPPTASPPSGPPAHTSPPVPSPPANHKPLPTPATAADPANPHAGRSPNSNKSSSPGARGGSSSQGGGLGDSVVIGVGTALAFLVLSLIGAAIWFTKKRRRGRNDYHAGFMSPTSPFSSQRPSGDSANVGSSIEPSVHTNYSAGSPRLKECMSDISMGNSCFFTYEEMYQITDGFSPQNLLGEGGFGSVYKGHLPDGKEVAVKQLKDGSGQGEREFQAEVEIISRVHHRHLVSLVGYCISNNQRLLVYDFVSNGTLHYHLHGHGRPVLDWSARVKIAAGAARGIAYLHEDCHPRIIHRDIKSSNILLDNNFDALVADFGLARLALDAVTHVTTRVMGTFGYMAPEYASSGKLTERSDVFSFGVVLLELITGRKPVDSSRPLGDESLVEWARPLLIRALETGNLEELVDPRLEKNFNEVEMYRMIEAAAACTRHSSSRRPRMSQVVRVLDSLADIDLTNGIQPGQSELFNVANTADVRMFQQMVLGNQDDSSGFSQYSWSSRSRGAEAASNSRIL